LYLGYNSTIIILAYIKIYQQFCRVYIANTILKIAHKNKRNKPPPYGHLLSKGGQKSALDKTPF